MSYYGEEDYDYRRRRRSPRDYEGRRSAQFLSPGNGGSLYRTRSTGNRPQPVINNIYVDQVNDNDADLRAESPYRRSPPSRRQTPAPYPASPEFRGRRLGDDLVEDLADMALRDRLRSRSRGRTDGNLMDRPDFAEWRLEQKERELAEERQRALWEKEAELQRLKDEAKHGRAETEAERERKRVIQDYEDNKRIEAQKIKDAEERLREKMERDKREAKEEEERVRRKIEREEREEKEREEREWKEFERKQREKEEKKKAEEKAEKEKIEAEMRKRLARFGYAENQIDVMVDEEKARKYQEERARGSRRPSPVGGQLVSWEPDREQFSRVRVRDMDIETLRYYNIKYSLDPRGEWIFIEEDISEEYTQFLFNHTKMLRAGDRRLLLEAPKEKKKYAWSRQRDRSTGRPKIRILEIRK